MDAKTAVRIAISSMVRSGLVVADDKENVGLIEGTLFENDKFTVIVRSMKDHSTTHVTVTCENDDGQ